MRSEEVEVLEVIFCFFIDIERHRYFLLDVWLVRRRWQDLSGSMNIILRTCYPHDSKFTIASLLALLDALGNTILC